MIPLILILERQQNLPQFKVKLRETFLTPETNFRPTKIALLGAPRHTSGPYDTPKTASSRLTKVSLSLKLK